MRHCTVAFIIFLLFDDLALFLRTAALLAKLLKRILSIRRKTELRLLFPGIGLSSSSRWQRANRVLPFTHRSAKTWSGPLRLTRKSHQAHYLLGYVSSAHERSGRSDRRVSHGDRSGITPAAHVLLTRSRLAVKTGRCGRRASVDQRAGNRRALRAAQCEVGKILLKEHRTSDVVGHLSAAIQYNPHSEEAHFLLVRAYRDLPGPEQISQIKKSTYRTSGR
jgi:hypothetical protein